MRFQAAAHRASKPDTDGDGIVDLADAFPQDPVDWLDLDGDGSGDVADPDADGDGVLDEDDRFPFDPTEWEDRDGDGLGDNADADVVDIAPFRDPVLRAAVERALGKASGAPITETDLSGLTTLEATVALPGEGIRDLTGLELAGNLAALELIFNQVSDLSPLSGLDRLAVLRLTGNEVADLGPLRGLPRLQELWLTFNPLADLSPLAELPGLSALHLGGHGHVISDPRSTRRTHEPGQAVGRRRGHHRPDAALRVDAPDLAVDPEQPRHGPVPRCRTCISSRWTSAAPR